ncbi:hypothetical protein Jab_2c28250 [Janthinobacterium sp. HH01]|nr:hypothetical protein Jab_2c28250 [Janthinobacterium sp. HH01]
MLIAFRAILFYAQKGLFLPLYAERTLFDINHELETLATMLFHHMGLEGVARKNL